MIKHTLELRPIIVIKFIYKSTQSYHKKKQHITWRGRCPRRLSKQNIIISIIATFSVKIIGLLIVTVMQPHLLSNPRNTTVAVITEPASRPVRDITRIDT